MRPFLYNFSSSRRKSQFFSSVPERFEPSDIACFFCFLIAFVLVFNKLPLKKQYTKKADFEVKSALKRRERYYGPIFAVF